MVLSSTLARHFIILVTFPWLLIGDSSSKTRTKQTFQDVGINGAARDVARPRPMLVGLDRAPWKPVPAGEPLLAPPTPSQATCTHKVPLGIAFRASQSNTRLGSPWLLGTPSRRWWPRETVLVPGLSPTPSPPTRLWHRGKSHRHRRTLSSAPKQSDPLQRNWPHGPPREGGPRGPGMGECSRRQEWV